MHTYTHAHTHTHRVARQSDFSILKKITAAATTTTTTTRSDTSPLLEQSIHCSREECMRTYIYIYICIHTDEPLRNIHNGVYADSRGARPINRAARSGASKREVERNLGFVHTRITQRGWMNERLAGEKWDWKRVIWLENGLFVVVVVVCEEREREKVIDIYSRWYIVERCLHSQSFLYNSIYTKISRGGESVEMICTQR